MQKGVSSSTQIFPSHDFKVGANVYQSMYKLTLAWISAHVSMNFSTLSISILCQIHLVSYKFSFYIENRMFIYKNKKIHYYSYIIIIYLFVSKIVPTWFVLANYKCKVLLIHEYISHSDLLIKHYGILGHYGVYFFIYLCF